MSYYTMLKLMLEFEHAYLNDRQHNEIIDKFINNDDLTKITELEQAVIEWQDENNM